MAVRNRRGRQVEVWPGYVDVLSNLLMVIVFVLMIFVIGQLFLSQILTGKDEALAKLNKQLAELADMLSLEQASNTQLKSQIQQLSGELTRSTAERDDLHNQVLALTTERNKLQQQLAVSQDQAKQLEDAYKTIDADKQKIQALLTDIATLQSLRDELQKKLNDSNANNEQITSEAQRRVEMLNQQILALRQQLADIAKALDITEQKNKDQNVQITELGKRLNAALATKVQELARYRSEFFGRLREVLGNRQDIQIVGDRFVFQSEVLFDSGSAEVSQAGKDQLDVLATTLILIAHEIPPELNWVLRVDGFTDKRPISNPQFPSNWELSTARAVAVVKYLVSRGIPPEHLAAAGFAEFAPLDPANTEEAYRKNRRIEMRFDQR
ncbi:MAG TPA: peptidoglycan -binding protein [Terriglobia bacterium]|nr:peptidoglycan -binding protein [Terriglobia bacterium]